MSEILDLFGEPVPANWGGRGRPPHIPTRENRDKVTMLLALGWGNERIAASLSITPPTLKKHYFRLLKFRDEQRDRLEAAYAVRLWDQVRDGNVGAMRLWAQFIERNDAAVGHDAFYGSQRRDSEAEKTESLGKKEQAAEAAKSAGQGTDWGNDLKPLH